MFNILNQRAARSVAVLVVTFACVVGPGLALATVIPSFGKAELFSRSDLIAEVLVGSARSLRAGRDGFIHTDSKVVVKSVWHARGEAANVRGGDVLSLRQIGGRVGDVEHSVVGTAPILPGDKLIVFVRYQAGKAYLVGMGQGAYLVLESPTGAFVRNMFGARPKQLRKGEGGELVQTLQATVRRLVDQARVRK